MSFLSQMFGFARVVDRSTYFTVGCVLMAVKYLGEAAIFYFFEERALLPQEFLNPMMVGRWVGKPTPYLYPQALWSLPFIWIGFSMSARRSIDAGLSPWWAFGFFVPFVNYAVMLVLSLLPSSADRKWVEDTRVRKGLHLKESIVAGVTTALIAVTVTALLVYVARSYSSALFMGLPFTYGFVLTMFLNWNERKNIAQVVAVLLLSLFLAGGCLLLFAMEGLICIAMAAPVVIAMSAVGALSADFFCSRWRPRKGKAPALFSVFLFPLFLQPALHSGEASEGRTVREVLSVIDIAAPPEKVWKNVIQFSDLPPPTEAIFKLGVAHPVRAVIEGEGVGAIRRCQFSTGDFVEPITEWREPEQLSFDVQFQPRPMHELSPYEQVHAPHLDSFLTSERGQFRLIRLPNGDTRLEGRTWYRMAIFPAPYWQVFADYFIHRIHMRVLRHIEAESVGV